MAWRDSKPVGLAWRSSSWFVTAVVALGIAVDLLVYSIIIPIMPYHLERLGHYNPSSMTGWLLFAYSGGLVLSTVPAAVISERYNERQIPLVTGLIFLLGAQAMLMEAPYFWVMCLARFIQGISSAVVWVVALALLCDCAPPSIIGLQLGIAMTGVSVGMVIGPPVGGLLYGRFGIRAPFIFGMSATFIDLVGRLLVIERKQALRWGVDPAVVKGAAPSDEGVEKGTSDSFKDAERPTMKDNEGQNNSEVIPKDDAAIVENRPKSLPLLRILSTIIKSPRAMAAVFITFIYGVVFTGLEPVIPPYLQSTWGLSVTQVGLVYIAAVVPNFVASPVAGMLSDKKGTELVTSFALLLSIPWWIALIVKKSLAAFIVLFFFQSFFTAAVLAPITAEFASFARGIDGVGYAHIYGAFNLAFGVGNTVGPIIGGQIYDHLARGWMVVCLLSAALIAVCLVVALTWVGDNPLLRRLRRRNSEKTQY